MKIINVLLILVFCVFSIFAQDKAKITEWRGLVLDQASPEKAIEVLGKPKTDKPNQKFRPLKFNEWFDVEAKNFREMHWEKSGQIEGFDDVKLFFRDDKLVSIWLEPKKLEANALQISYDGEFVYLTDKFAQTFNPGDFERNQGETYPKSFPEVYYLMNKNEVAYGFVLVANNSLGSILGKSLGVQDAGESLPGKISVINLISTSLQSKKGTNLLK